MTIWIEVEDIHGHIVARVNIHETWAHTWQIEGLPDAVHERNTYADAMAYVTERLQEDE